MSAVVTALLFLILGQGAIGLLENQMEDKSEDDNLVDSLAKYVPGDARIILSVPHGGTTDCPDIPDRVNGCLIEGKAVWGRKSRDSTCAYEGDASCATDECKVTTVTDSMTVDLGRRVADAIEEELGVRPHLVYSNLLRTKLDPNREIEEAAQGNLLAMEVYNAYHDYIRTASEAVGRGILFDLHGQNHKQNSSEIGYLLTTSQLNDNDIDPMKVSIRTLCEESNVDPALLVSGAESFGAMLEEQGYKAVPSPRQPAPGEDKYYPGGFITKTYGSLLGGPLDAIQVETPYEVRVEAGSEGRKKFAKGLGTAIANFFKRYYE